jgi:plasmid stabilization system protein ParE
MKKYKVILHPDAELDIASSFEWGCRAWGIKNARAWVQELRHAILNQLTSVPFRCPVAPEADELGISVRHLILGRYRIVFIVKGLLVTILHVRGPYIAGVDPDESEK